MWHFIAGGVGALIAMEVILTVALAKASSRDSRYREKTLEKQIHTDCY